MTKVLVLFYQYSFNGNDKNIFCYYESFAKELVRYGNEVMMVNLASYKKDYWDYTLLNENYLNEKIKNFNPDIIFTYNNQIYKNIFNITNCPVLIFDADSSCLFPCKDFIQKYQDRYYMITHYENWENNYEEFGILKDRICSIHLATAIENEKIEKDKNISFIGTKFTPIIPEELIDYIKNNNQSIYDALKEFWQTGIYDYEYLIKKHCPNSNFNKTILHNIFDSRNYVLSSVLDLGLELYGELWNEYPDPNIPLFSAFNNEPKFSLKHNQDLYNSSKICLSISHPQTKGFAFPWRVYDIMASNSVLVTSESKLLKQQTDGFVDLPMYSSPFDVREMCKKLLLEPNLRDDITEASNKFIEAKGRWKDNFEKIESFVNIKLLNEEKQNSNISDSIQIVLNKKRNYFYKLEAYLASKKKRLACLFKFILSEFPIVELFYPAKKRNKLYRKISKLK